MSKNRELVNELKSESSNRRNFFKEKIKEEWFLHKSCGMTI